jgi:hypothetical protein
VRAGALLAAMFATLMPGTAAAASPWQAEERMQAALFDAQTTLLLDAPPAGAEAPRPALRRVRAARLAFRGPLASGLRREAPAAHRDVRAALHAATEAVATADQVPRAAGLAPPCSAAPTP